MPDGRPSIPRPLERSVLVEAGHRCAIPQCRQTPVELAHIKPWAEVKTHTFDNLIALCPTCHTRYDQGEIDRLAMLQYKANLSVMNGRYGDLEQRVLRVFADQPGATQLNLPGGLEILLMYLIQDGLLAKMVNAGPRVEIMGVPSQEFYVLTNEGRAFINRWLAAEPLNL